MTDDDRKHIQNLIDIHQRNLKILQNQAARYGDLAVPMHILTQIDDIKGKIADLEGQLRGLPPGFVRGEGTGDGGVASEIGTGDGDRDVRIGTGDGDTGARPVSPAQVTLRFEPSSDGATIRWEGFALGHETSKFAMPYKAKELPVVIKALDAAQYPNHPTGGPQFSDAERKLLADLGLWNGTRVSPDICELVGKKIYDALTQDPNGNIALRLARESARNQGQPLSYVLRFPADAVDLASLPWEAMWDKRQAVLLSSGASELDSLERYLDLDEALSPPLPAGKKLHILALSPQAGIPDSVRQSERAARLKSWGALKDRGLIDWDELSPVTTRSLNDRMRNGPRPDIIHYYGHGVYKDGQGYLLFDSADAPGKIRRLEAGKLATQLGGIRLIMIHACQSAMVDDEESEGGLLTGVAPALSAVSEAVVAMQLTIRIQAATRFSEVFYEEIARGRSLQAAVAEARRAVYLDEEDSASWHVPTLYIRTREQRPVYLVQPRR
jgi:hypothetical protein